MNSFESKLIEGAASIGDEQVNSIERLQLLRKCNFALCLWLKKGAQATVNAVRFM